MEFNERYRVALPSGKVALIPAWICDRAPCRYGRPVRRNQQRIELHGVSAKLRAQGNRQLMKARAQRDRAPRVPEKSIRRRDAREAKNRKH